MDIAGWLRSLGLAQYEATFREHQIDSEVLPELAEVDLEKLGIPLGHRKRLLKAIRPLQTEAPASEPAAPPITISALDSSHLAERRQLTVMFCDLVGSTALSARLDPEDLREMIGAYHRTVAETVRRFDGFVAKYMGDGVLVYFGYPRAHEDDAERAVRAGLEVIAAVERLAAPVGRLEVRIGIATGLVVVGDLIGEGASEEQAVVGEALNVAARLQGLARPGTIVVPSATRSLLGNLFKLRELGRHELKGLSEPVEVWAVEGAPLIKSRFESMRSSQLSGFVGREAEIRLLMDRWNLAQEGEGQVVLLSGEPGIGKSRLLSELRARLGKAPLGTLRFQCSPYYVNSAFYPVINNFELTLKFRRDETSEAKLDKLESLIVTQYGCPRDDCRFIASVLSIPYEARYGTAPMTPQKFKDETLRALVDTMEAAARKRPTILLFEDAHWADPTSLEAIDLVVNRVARVPLLVVITYRPEFQSRWSHFSHVTTLTLTRLTQAQSRALVSGLTGGRALPWELLHQILNKTDGVPLFIEELTESILASPELEEAWDHYTYARSTGSLTIPLSLRDSLMSRLDRVMPVKEVAQIGAAIGHSFSYELIAAVAPHSRPELDQALGQLTVSGLAFRQGTPPDAVYSFKHALVRDVAYESLLKSRRQALHAKIARVIEKLFPAAEDTEPELLAHHYTEANQCEKGIALWHKAGKLALKRIALNEAIRHLERGLYLARRLPLSMERDGWELNLRTALGMAWMALRGWSAQEVWDSLHAALTFANLHRRGDALMPILRGLWVNVLTRGQVAESLGWVERILSAAAEYDDEDLLIVGHNAATTSYSFLGQLLETRAHADQVLSLYNEAHHRHLAITLNSPKTTSLGHKALATWALGYPEQAVEISRVMIAHARELGQPFDLGWALTLGSHVFDYLHEAEELKRRAEEAERLGRENSMPFMWNVLARGYSGVSLIRQGNVQEGVATLKAYVTIHEKGGGRIHSPHSKSVLAEGMAQLGELEDALRLINEAIEQIERPGWQERVHYAEILRIKGWLLAHKSDIEGAERNYLASLDWARHQQAKSWELRTAMSYALLMRDQGRTKEAYELLAPIYGWFTEGFETKDLEQAKALLEGLAALGSNAPSAGSPATQLSR